MKSIIEDAVAIQVKKEMQEWGSNPGIARFVGGLESTVEYNDVLIGETRIHLENS